MKLARALTLSILAICFLVVSSLFIYKKYYKNYYLTTTGIINYADGIGRQIIDLHDLIGNDIKMNVVADIAEANFIPKSFINFLEEEKNRKLGYVVLHENPFPLSFQEDNNLKEKITKLRKHRSKNFINRLDRSEQIYIAYSMFESDRIPNFWVYEINKNWDMVVVPDPSLVDVYINSGVTKPIFMVPLGTNLSTHLESPLKKKSNAKGFTFANFSTLDSRKNSLKLVQAFHLAFSKNNNVRLLLSARSNTETYNEILSYIQKHGVHGVTIELGAKSNDYYNFLFDKVDCYVSPSKGEGFSVQPREAMARGIPTIVTDILAQKTIVDTGLVKVVPGKKLISDYYSSQMNLIGNFQDIETSDLADAMLDVYNEYPKYIDNGQAARNWAEKGQYKHLKEEYINMVKPKKIILGDRNEITKDHLMTNSKELYNKFIKLKQLNLQ